jgi:DNA polymerase
MTHPRQDRLAKSLIDFWADMLGPDPDLPETPARLAPAEAHPATPRPAEPKPSQSLSPSSPPSAPPSAPPSRPEPRRLQTDPAAEARALARAAGSLPELRAAVEAFTGCPLRAAARSTVVWDGAANSSILVIDTGPGDDEDVSGQPVSGRAGRLFDRMLASIGLSRERQVCVTGLVYWRRPGNRPPTAAELELCSPFLARHLELLRPRMILTLGAFAAKSMEASGDDLMQAHGRRTVVSPPGSDAPIACIPLLHPAYLLRRPQDKEKAWRDMLAVADLCEDLRLVRDRGL